MTKVNLSQKEKMLLEDQKSHEKICIEKYTNYANQAKDPELKQLLKTYAGEEQEHYDTINQILSGTVPDLNQQSQKQNTQSSQGGQSSQSNAGSVGSAGMYDKNDASLCSDLLMTEKYISGAYNTTIFECVDTSLRDALNHIQKEEQQHGEGIFNYMQSKGMYNVK
jgi:spore coat protein CotF